MLKVLSKLWTCPSSIFEREMLTWVKLIWTHLFLWINVLPHLKARPWITHKTGDQWWQYKRQRKRERFILTSCRKTCITLTSAKSARCRILQKCNRNWENLKVTTTSASEKRRRERTPPRSSQCSCRTAKHTLSLNRVRQQQYLTRAHGGSVIG